MLRRPPRQISVCAGFFFYTPRAKNSAPGSVGCILVKMKYKGQKISFRSAYRTLSASRQAFTLVELLVVIAIIGLLSSVAVTATASSRNKARYARVAADLTQIAKAAELYYSSAGTYPADQSPGVLPPEFSSSMASWPKPPCSNWLYDWQNWTSGNVIEASTAVPGIGYQFHYCVYASPGYACSGGYEVTSYAPKTITCNE